MITVMSSARTFVGGMNVPAALGRANASVPLAELVLDGSRVTLRPRAIGRFMLGEFVVARDLIESAFKVHGHLATSGVGFRLVNGTCFYFWTRHEQDAVLAAVASMGMLVEPGSQPVRTEWTLKRPEPGTPVVTLSPLLGRLAPVLVALSVLVLVVLWQAAEEWWLRLALVALWALSSAVTLGLWWSSRQRSVGT